MVGETAPFCTVTPVPCIRSSFFFACFRWCSACQGSPALQVISWARSGNKIGYAKLSRLKHNQRTKLPPQGLVLSSPTYMPRLGAAEMVSKVERWVKRDFNVVLHQNISGTFVGTWGPVSKFHFSQEGNSSPPKGGRYASDICTTSQARVKSNFSFYISLTG